MTSRRVRKIAFADVAPNRKRGGEIRALLTPVTVESTSGFMGIAVLEPGEFIGEHYHPYSEEFLYIMEGAVTALLDGISLQLTAGEAVMLPPFVRHRLENGSTQQARLVFHLGPLAPRPELGHVDTEPVQQEIAVEAASMEDAR